MFNSFVFKVLGSLFFLSCSHHHALEDLWIWLTESALETKIYSMRRVPYNKLLTNLACSSHTGEYWPSVVFIQTSCQCSPVQPSCSVSNRLEYSMRLEGRKTKFTAFTPNHELYIDLIKGVFNMTYTNPGELMFNNFLKAFIILNRLNKNFLYQESMTLWVNLRSQIKLSKKANALFACKLFH